MRRLIPAVLGAAVTLSGCGFHGLYSAPLPGGADLGDHPYSLTAEFADVLDLVPQSAVKVNDVPVGKVTSISLGTDRGRWVAKVTMSVRGTVQLASDAHASVLQTSLLGEKYVALLQSTTAEQKQDFPALADGQHPPLLKTGDKIPISRTSSAYEAEQVLGALSLVLNEGGLRQIQVIATELNKALGNGAQQAAIRDLISQLNTFVGTLDNQKDDITTALENVNTLAATLNKQKKILTDALDNFPRALNVLNQERTKLVTLLTSLSNLGNVASRVVTSTQQSLVTALKTLDPAVTQLTAAGSDLVGALRIGGTFPFPLGLARQFVKGDYANLAADINLNLTDQLCGLLGICANGASGAAQKLGAPVLKQILSGLKVNSEKTTPLNSMLVGGK
ncbi:MCE family protein [uncultured Jatrophihabitans sp.]|uniref:MCE family protein n=1 Tax=uncultured Jatrophihabitans sp. TaxID=1610747 RepID=UPI0035CA95AF